LNETHPKNKKNPVLGEIFRKFGEFHAVFGEEIDGI
jgi:hypothetical protein